MSAWFDVKEGRGIALSEMFEKLSDQELLGADYALRVLWQGLGPGKKATEAHILACREVMKKRPALLKKEGAA